MPTHPVATTLLSIAQIHPNPDQPRKNFDPQELADLRDSIREEGLVNPISVMQRGEGDFLIIAGERRFRAASELGWKEIDARIWPKETTPAEVELLALVENVQRTNLTPIEVAKGYRRLSEPPFDMSQEEIAGRVAKPRSTVAEFLGLLEHPQAIQDQISSGYLTVSHARVLKRVEDIPRRIALAELAVKQGWSFKETEKRVTGLLGKKARMSHRKRAGLLKDPLSRLWPTLLNSTRIGASGAWDVSYKGRYWQFRVDSAVLPDQPLLADWFRQMAEALDPTPEGVTPSKGALSDALASLGQPRLPKTPEEKAELAALAKGSTGPSPIYGWIYGPESPITLGTQKSTWDTFGVRDPQDGLQNILDEIIPQT